MFCNECVVHSDVKTLPSLLVLQERMGDMVDSLSRLRAFREQKKKGERGGVTVKIRFLTSVHSIPAQNRLLFASLS